MDRTESGVRRIYPEDYPYGSRTIRRAEKNIEARKNEKSVKKDGTHIALSLLLAY